jgi:serine/threonine protein kinase
LRSFEACVLSRGAQNSPRTNTFVLKTCSAKGTHDHESKVEAYKTVIQHTGDLSNMVRFYGSWRQGGRYNMLLEYVDGGSLEDFFRKNMPPTRGEDILKFWENILELSKAVMHIHRLPSTEGSRRSLQGSVSPSLFDEVTNVSNPASIMTSRPATPSSLI